MTNQLPKKHKGRKATKYRGAECLNCGTPTDLSDVYCSYCGQLNTTKSLSLKDFFGEFIGSIITYDSKFRYTLKDLLFRPGVITRNYVGGQRFKYANPFRFFLSVSIIYFILQGLITTFTGKSSFINTGNNNDNSNNFELVTDNDGFKLVPTQNDSVAGDSANSNSPTAPFLDKETDSLWDVNAKKYNYPTQEELDSVIQKAMTKDTVQTYEPISETALDTLNWTNRTIKRLVLYYDFYKTTKIKDPKKALDSLDHRNTRFNRWAYEKNDVFEQVQENPTEFFTYLMEKTPFFVFFFTPFYALFFWLIYSKKKYTYMEHMVFIFHIFSFIFLAMIIALIPDTLFDMELFYGLLFGIVGPFYFYKALRNFYKQNRFITIIKFLFLNFVFWVSASMSALFFFAITAAFY